MSKTPISKISKKDLLSCKCIKDLSIDQGIITFHLMVMEWVGNKWDAEPMGTFLKITCPDVDQISHKSFTPTHHKDIQVGSWLQSLIEQGNRDLPKNREEFQYEKSMDQSYEEFKMEMGDSEFTEVLFLEVAIKTIKKYKHERS